jgi:hypothetical protein
MLRRTGEEKEEDSGDCISAVAGFGTGCVVGGRRRIAEGGSGILVGAFLRLSGTCRSAPLRLGWVLLFLSFVSFFSFFKYKLYYISI